MCYDYFDIQKVYLYEGGYRFFCFVLCYKTELRGRVVITRASYSGDSGLKFRPGNQVF
jgi:hypothetical protein